MREAQVSFVHTTAPAPELDLWSPIVIPGEEIEAAIETLAERRFEGSSRPEYHIVHPRASKMSGGLAPGIGVALSVLRPGEATVPRRENATQVNFCIRGHGTAIIRGEHIRFGQYDAWNTAPYATYQHVNDGDELQVRLTYSNAPLLKFLNVHIVDDGESEAGRNDGRSSNGQDVVASARAIPISGDGALLMPYEGLINPPPIPSRTFHWPWPLVKEQLDRLAALGKEYTGRRLYLLYNPDTGRTNGTTSSFFATVTIRPPKIVDRPHRHTSAAINYYFRGRGRSVVAGKTYEWKAGDLMLSAPGWATHHHASYDEPVYELTVQDQPSAIALEYLLWQEDLRHPPRLLGSDPGFGTNRSEVFREI